MNQSEIARALETHYGTVVNAVRRVLPAGDPDFQDVIQNVSTQLFQKSLPRFRDEGPVNLYLLVAADNAARNEAKRLRVRRERERANGAAREPEAAMPIMAVEVAAKRLMESPERWLTPWQSEVLRELRRSQGEPLSITARRLGYRSHAGLSMAIRRIRDRLSELDLSDFDEDG